MGGNRLKAKSVHLATTRTQSKAFVMTEISIRTDLGRIHLVDDESSFDGDDYDCCHVLTTDRGRDNTVLRGIHVWILGSKMASCLAVLPGQTPLTHAATLVRNRTLYLASGDTLCALDARELVLLWSRDLPSGFENGFYFPMLDRAVIAVGNRHVTCINSDGSVRWNSDLPQGLGGKPILGEDQLILPFQAGQTMAIDCLSGLKSEMPKVESPKE